MNTPEIETETEHVTQYRVFDHNYNYTDMVLVSPTVPKPNDMFIIKAGDNKLYKLTVNYVIPVCEANYVTPEENHNLTYLHFQPSELIIILPMAGLYNVHTGEFTNDNI